VKRIVLQQNKLKNTRRDKRKNEQTTWQAHRKN
jgi:hypothetical protein